MKYLNPFQQIKLTGQGTTVLAPEATPEPSFSPVSPQVLSLGGGRDWGELQG